MRSTTLMLLVLVLGPGCSDLLGFETPHVVVDADPDTAALPHCDYATPFDAPIKVPGLSLPNTDERTARLLPDELTAFFNGGAVSSQLFVATRPSVTDPFGTPTELASLNTAQTFDPSPSRDGLTLYYSADTGGGIQRLFVARRTTLTDSFTQGGQLTNVSPSMSSEGDGQPYLPGDTPNDELWFTSNRAGGLGGSDIWRATFDGTTFVNPVLVPELSSSYTDWLPVLSRDKLTVYFSTDRPTSLGDLDIWTSHRDQATDPFPPPHPVDEVNSADGERSTWLSDDDCRLYLFRVDPSGRDVYVAVRRP
ncbi:MAG TPA: hypothetical protein VGM90_28585 [Kofleriaceae bacterium]|jgi:hypothetical protein